MSPYSILSSSFCLLSIILLAVGIGNAQKTANPDPSLDSARLNQVQVIGTHNSYHIAATPPVMQALRARNEKLAMSLDYTHRPLADQFSMFGIRQIELDVFADPKGGLYAEPSVLRTIAGAGALPAPVSEMQKTRTENPARVGHRLSNYRTDARQCLANHPVVAQGSSPKLPDHGDAGAETVFHWPRVHTASPLWPGRARFDRPRDPFRFSTD